jgi:murein DD-endopeptidase MepM/ murein hydrolase activator NlpD
MAFRDIHRPRAVLLLSLCLSTDPFSMIWGRMISPPAASERFHAKAARSSRRAKRKPGIYHRLQKGQTLSSLSRAYRIPVATLVSANGIGDPDSIPAGTPIFVPGARRVLAIQEDDASPLAWPLEGRIMTQFNAPGGRHHDGIDIDGELGQQIRAAAAGRVLEAGKDGRYGSAVLIDHGDGLATFYAHASKLLVQTGDRVEQGEAIALVGRSGNARGTHLHFEVRRDGCAVNPLALLPDPALVASRRR